MQPAIETQWQKASLRLLGSARLLVYLSATILLTTFLYLIVWSRRYGQPLGYWQWLFHGIAIAIHVAAMQFLLRWTQFPRLIGFLLVSGAVAMAKFPAGMFHIGMWPEAGLIAAAGILCLCCAPIRIERSAKGA